MMTHPKIYVCPKCHHEFETLFAFNRHVREAHPEPAKPLGGKK